MWLVAAILDSIALANLQRTNTTNLRMNIISEYGTTGKYRQSQNP